MNMHVKADSKFKVGDRVLATDTADGQFTKGKIYEVSAVSSVSLSVKSDDRGRPNGWTLSKFIPAPLFAVGDKVRVANNVSGRVSYVGRTGVIASDDFGYGDGTSLSVKLDGDGCSLIFSALELIPTYTSCAAAEVDNLADEYGGGKAMRLEAGKSYVGDDGKTYGPFRTFEYGGGSFIIEIGDGNIWGADGKHGEYNVVKVNMVAVAAVPAPTLTIRAGAYYKTRDGRKVGPMEHRHAGFTWRNHGEVRYVDAEGKHLYGLRNCDLIAEWPAEWPATPTTMADIVRKHSGTAIVCLIENGQPKPSTRPFVHLNKDAAATEANRLAGIHKGQEFGVYECVDVRKVERVYDHEWQRLAARGSKIPAIKALRDLAGIDLAAAKSGVDQFLVRAA